MSHEEIKIQLERSEAQATAEDAQAAMLRASAAEKRLLCDALRQLIAENEALKQNRIIRIDHADTVALGDYVQNKTNAL